MRLSYLGSLLAIVITACAKPLPADKADYAGYWAGGNVALQISQQGTINYKRVQGNTTKTLDVPLKEFVGNDFVAGIGPMTTTFKVNRAPYRDGEIWKMVVDGVELMKIDRQQAPHP